MTGFLSLLSLLPSSQLRAEVSGLQGELEGKRSEMDTLETLLQRRERESQEGANHLAMLRDDLSTVTQQRSGLRFNCGQWVSVYFEPVWNKRCPPNPPPPPHPPARPGPAVSLMYLVILKKAQLYIFLYLLMLMKRPLYT